MQTAPTVPRRQRRALRYVFGRENVFHHQRASLMFCTSSRKRLVGPAGAFRSSSKDGSGQCCSSSIVSSYWVKRPENLIKPCFCNSIERRSSVGCASKGCVGGSAARGWAGPKLTPARFLLTLRGGCGHFCSSEEGKHMPTKTFQQQNDF